MWLLLADTLDRVPHRRRGRSVDPTLYETIRKAAIKASRLK